MVEVDGGYHTGGAVAPARGAIECSRGQGYRVLRLDGELGLADLSRAVSIIVDNLG